ncbi:hypothetical protein QRD02_07145 [Aequorivita sp. SDUM287046]|uniref:Lipoprotein n=1 Tax=Aequorivita aurantiaca TaxID=3053356 RepID=A0ABT8DGV5_9FLAO|nr:hypothetical protein [Aequorivita aurantiaca]MDN3724153.1 hypothetical protein [Aequorivita aurantiaca]
MKTIKFVLVTIMILGFTSCNNSNRDRTDNVNNRDINLEDTADDMDSMEAGNNTNASNASQNNDPTAMYKQLNMSPEQIQRFESENPNFRDSIGNSQWRSNATMDNSMRNILSTDQYQQYETWRDNRTGNNNAGSNSTNNNTNTQTNNYQNGTNQNNRNN